MASILTEGANNLTDGSVALTDNDFAAPTGPSIGPLVVSVDNPRYFAKPDGTVVYLNGSHTWNNGGDDRGTSYPPPLFGYTAYITYMQSVGSNFMRFWMNETAFQNFPAFYYPFIYARPGPGTLPSPDGRPLFDISTFDQSYFDRLRARVIEAGARDIYCSVMMWNGWSTDDKPAGDPWSYHPFKLSNNINGINGDPSSTGNGVLVHTATSGPIWDAQIAYMHKLVDTVNDLDNVLYEIGNEHDNNTVAWQYAMINAIKAYEATGGRKIHPVGMTSCFAGDNTDLVNSPADWVSFGSLTAGGDDGHNSDPPASTGAKVSIQDVDHLFPSPAATSDVWTWKSFLRGHSVIHMDDMSGLGIANNIADAFVQSWNGPMRRAMQQTGQYAARMNLRVAPPNNALSSTTYCLANPGTQYLVLAPSGSSITVNLSAGAGKHFTVEWFKISDGTVSTPADVAGGSSSQSFTSPFSSNASVLFLNEAEEPGDTTHLPCVVIASAVGDPLRIGQSWTYNASVRLTPSASQAGAILMGQICM